MININGGVIQLVAKGRELDFDLAFIVNNGKVKVIGNKLEGYEHE